MENLEDKLQSVASHICKTYLQTPTKAAIRLLASILTPPMDIKKGEHLIEAGNVSDSLYYVESGLVRQYYFKNGRDATEHFAQEGTVFINIESYFLGQPTVLLAEALEQSVIYGIPQNSMRRLMKESTELCSLYQRILEGLIIDLSRHLDEYRFETAAERYQHFMKTSSEIIRRAPLVHIASYLLMTPETLSRVRACI
jgi:CRP-like cAMP-binding protein